MGKRGCAFPCGTVQKYKYHKRYGEEACRACKDAMAANQRAKYRRPTSPKVSKIVEQRSMIRAFKFAAGSCMDCGLVVDERTIVCFDLDHRDPQNKSFTISYVKGKVPTNEMRDELAKCDVVCRNCHAIRTHEGQHYLVRRNGSDDRPTLFDVA